MTISNLAPEEGTEVLPAFGPSVKHTCKILLPLKCRKGFPKLNILQSVLFP